MTLTQAAAGILVFVLGFSVAHLRHDRDRLEWQMAWVIGQNRRQATLLRRVLAVLGLPGGDELADPEPYPTFSARLREELADMWSFVSRRPAPAEADPLDVGLDDAVDEPVTEPFRRPQPTPRGPDTVPTGEAVTAWQHREIPGTPHDVDAVLSRFSYAAGHNRQSAAPADHDDGGDD